MTSEIAPSLVRASGIVATVLVATALVSGLFFSARETGHRRKPNWWLDLHNGLGGLSLVAIGVHIAATLADTKIEIGVAEAFIPGVATSARWALGWGVISAYLYAITVFTSWPNRLPNRQRWRLIHLTSVPAGALAVTHGYLMGTDATQLVFRLGLIAVAVPVVYAVTLRVTNATARARLQRR